MAEAHGTPFFSATIPVAYAAILLTSRSVPSAAARVSSYDSRKLINCIRDGAYHPPARVREPSHDNGISHPVAIRPHGPEAKTQSLDFPPIAFPRCQDRLVAPRLQTQRESHVRVQVAERTPRGDDDSPTGVIDARCGYRIC